MNRSTRVIGMVAAFLLIVSIISGCGGKSSSGTAPADTGAKKDEPVTLNVAVAGDTNMVEMFKAVAEDFKKQYPNISLNPVGTGTGDPGSNAIFTKLDAQNKAGTDKWDLDVAIVHQSIMGPMLENKLLLKYVGDLQNAKLVVGDGAKNALGVNVDGYVVPMFQSQVGIGYTEQVKEPPKDFASLVDWIKANPKKFGYNGVKGGMSGVGFVTGWVYWKSKDYQGLTKGPYDANKMKTWAPYIKELKALPVTYTDGNAGTLDGLNRGEIWMGPVWVDMYYVWVREGRMNPKVRVKLIEPGLPGQPMYYVIPAKAAHADAAKKFVDYMSSVETQVKYIVQRNGWYPGVDPSAVLSQVPQDAKDKLFKDISAQDLAKFGQSFPLAQYAKDILTAYEQN